MLNDKNIYFDHNATFPIYHEVKKDMMNLMSYPLNPSSIHNFGRCAKNILENSRNIIKNFLNAENNYNIIFTSSGTEANNLALKSFPNLFKIASKIEHPSVLKITGTGIIPVNSNGIIVLSELENLLKKIGKKTLVSVIFANNETGVIQPISDIINIAHKYDSLVHTDAVQIVGKEDININKLNVDLMTISAHKFGGPNGAGCLIYKKNLELSPILLGGGQEFKIRSGTQNLPAIHGFAKACQISASHMNKFNKVEILRDYIEHSLKLIDNNIIIFGKNATRLSNTSSISMKKVSSEIQVIHFDINGVAVSAGSACSSGKVTSPYVQLAMGYSQSIANTAIRISLGPSNTKEEADKFISLWKNLYKKNN